MTRAIAIDYIYSKICLLIDRNYTVIGIICTGVVVTFLIIWWMFLSIGIERWLGVVDYVCVLMIVIDYLITDYNHTVIDSISIDLLYCSHGLC